MGIAWLKFRLADAAGRAARSVGIQRLPLLGTEGCAWGEVPSAQSTSSSSTGPRLRMRWTLDGFGLAGGRNRPCGGKHG